MLDEFGPFSIKMHGGRSLMKDGELKTVPQWQRNKGSLILTAALELFTNGQMDDYYQWYCSRIRKEGSQKTDSA